MPDFERDQKRISSLNNVFVKPACKFTPCHRESKRTVHSLTTEESECSQIRRIAMEDGVSADGRKDVYARVDVENYVAIRAELEKGLAVVDFKKFITAARAPYLLGSTFNFGAVYEGISLCSDIKQVDVPTANGRCWIARIVRPTSMAADTI